MLPPIKKKKDTEASCQSRSDWNKFSLTGRLQLFRYWKTRAHIFLFYSFSLISILLSFLLHSVVFIRRNSLSSYDLAFLSLRPCQNCCPGTFYSLNFLPRLHLFFWRGKSGHRSSSCPVRPVLLCLFCSWRHSSVICLPCAFVVCHVRQDMVHLVSLLFLRLHCCLLRRLPCFHCLRSLLRHIS